MLFVPRLVGRSLAVLGLLLPAASAAPDPDGLMLAANRFRGFAEPYRFVAEIEVRSRQATSTASNRRRAGPMVVEVRSNGFAKQLVRVRRPRRGDVLLKIGDDVWLRPRRLHRLTRIPLHLRVLGGAAISDVAAVDLSQVYHATVRPGGCDRAGDLVLELAARAERTRYPRARYRVDCRTSEPRQIDFMTANGRTLKTLRYDAFDEVLGTRIATAFTIEDHVFRDTSVVRMSAFELLGDGEPDYTPGYLLSLALDVD